MTSGQKLFALGFVLVVIDQITKFLVKTNMCLGESIPVIGDFFRICFVENEGMAFGMKWGGAIGKICLSSFRILLFGFLWVWICRLIKGGVSCRGKLIQEAAQGAEAKAVPVGVLVGLAVIAAGAMGNIIDCWFYGLIFSESTPWAVAEFGGVPYAPFMLGKVVDMLSFSIFPPVFNFADSCVTCGAVYLALFQWKFFSQNQ